MSEESKVIEKSILKKQIVMIPIKLAVTFVLLNVVGKPIEIVDISSFFTAVYCYIALYSICTLVACFAKAVGNWLFGLILFLVCLFAIGTVDMPKILELLLGFAVIFGAAIVDVSRIVKLIRLSVKPKESPTESQTVPVIVVNTVSENE